MNKMIIMEPAALKTVKQPAKKSKPKKSDHSLEYELIASLALHKYADRDGAHYEQLLSIALHDRIPGLITEYGIKRMHRLIVTLLEEFCSAVPLPKSHKLTETRISVCTCDLMLAAQEDQLGLEDLIVFFELAKTGKFGKFKSVLTHYSIMEKLEMYRQERYENYMQLKQEKLEALKNTEPVERISPEPTAIKHLFEQAGAKIIPFKKIC